MIKRANSGYSQLENICRQAEQQFSSLFANMKNAARLMGDLRNLRDLIDCIPMGTSEYDVTVSRINNAQRYLESFEQGAAKYEIRQLVRTLRARLYLAGIANPANVVFEPANEPAEDLEQLSEGSVSLPAA